MLEIILDERLKARTIPTLLMMGIIEIPNLDILTNATHKALGEECHDNRLKSNLLTATHRLQKNARKAPNRRAKHRYENALSEISTKLQTLTAHTTATPPRMKTIYLIQRTDPVLKRLDRSNQQEERLERPQYDKNS